MSTTTLEKTAVDTGSDLASLVIAYHRRQHSLYEPENCHHTICKVAAECVKLDEALYGTDV